MERLTNKREADAQREEYERRLANGYPRNIPEERFLRLAAYEDTRLAPEEVAALQKDWSDLRTTIGECGGIDRLRELAEADKDGRVAVVHGRWGHLGGDEWLCTACGFVITTEGSWDKPTQKYCEDCGAKMDGGNS